MHAWSGGYRKGVNSVFFPFSFLVRSRDQSLGTSGVVWVGEENVSNGLRGHSTALFGLLVDVVPFDSPFVA